MGPNYAMWLTCEETKCHFDKALKNDRRLSGETEEVKE